MSNTHLIIDGDTDKPVALAIAFVTDTDETSCSSDVEQFVTKCNPDWGWNEAKKREVFQQVMDEVNPPAAPKKKAVPNNNSASAETNPQ